MPKRTDANQKEIVAELRKIGGVSVQDIHEVGHGCGDILVGWRGLNYIFEIKTPSGRMNKLEREWWLNWGGQYAVIRSAEEALNIMELADVLRRLGIK